MWEGPSGTPLGKELGRVGGRCGSHVGDGYRGGHDGHSTYSLGIWLCWWQSFSSASDGLAFIRPRPVDELNEDVTRSPALLLCL